MLTRAYVRFSIFAAPISITCGIWLGACGSQGTDNKNVAGSGPGGATSTGGVSAGGMGGETSGTGGQPATSPPYPSSLHETGLYDGASGEKLAPGVFEFKPRFVLFSDNATKRRFVKLPPGAKIDTTKPDYFDFPAGSKFWKEFTRDGVRVETRYLEKRANGGWTRIAYQWNLDQTAALPVPMGVPNANGTEHDIPSQDICSSCHSRTEGEVLGFSAIQLAYDSPLLDLADLNSQGSLSSPLPDTLALPGSAQDQAALGYLHVNCGTCHNPTSSVQGRVDMDLRLRLDTLNSLASTPVCTSAVGKNISVVEGTEPPGATLRIAPGSSSTSAVFLRMNSRGETYSMPPFGTELIDSNPGTGVELLAQWIDGLTNTSCTPP